jgi:uncharacterized protein (DUF111 family)
MTRHLHIDPVAGVSGDMLLAALIDAGAPIDGVRELISTPPNASRVTASPGRS